MIFQSFEISDRLGALNPVEVAVAELPVNERCRTCLYIPSPAPTRMIRDALSLKKDNDYALPVGKICMSIPHLDRALGSRFLLIVGSALWQ